MSQVQLTQTVVTLSAGITTFILGSNNQRNYLLIQNVGQNDLQIGFNNSLTAGNGTTLSPGGLGAQGGSILFDQTYIPQNTIYAVSAIGSTIVILEG